MPLSAEVGGELIVAPQVPSEEWKDLVRRVRAGTVGVGAPAGCGSPGHPKIRKGLQYFAHNPGAGKVCTVHGSETDAHLRNASPHPGRSCRYASTLQRGVYTKMNSSKWGP